MVHPEADFTPGHSVFGDMERLISESAVFIAVMSNHYCSNYFCQLEISEARTTGKPIILIFKESVDKTTMGLVIRDVYMNNKRARVVHDGASCRIDPSWEHICKEIVLIMNISD